MICDFVLRNEKEWICEKCGRRVTRYKSENFMPTAKCRIPDNYHMKSGYIGNKKIVGVGDYLARIFKQLGYSYRAVSSARAKINKLNSLGIDWCDQHQDIILLWIKDECLKQQVHFYSRPIRSIIRLAILKAKNQVIEI